MHKSDQNKYKADYFHIKFLLQLIQDPKSSFHGKRGKENLFSSLVNLFVGGSDTISSTLNWALFYLAKQPEIQAKAFNEIIHKVGHDRLPSLEDRSGTPLVEAIVMETHRMCSLAFSGIPRLVTKDTKLGEYFLPKVSKSFWSLNILVNKGWGLSLEQKYFSSVTRWPKF